MMLWKKLFKKLKSQDKRLIPSDRLLAILGIAVLLVVCAQFWGLGLFVFILVNGVLLGIILLDGFTLSQFPSVSALRKKDMLFEIDQWNRVEVVLSSSAPLNTFMWIKDDYPDGFSVSQRQFTLNWQGETEQAFSYQAKPHRRGRHFFHDVHIRMESRWKLLVIQERLRCEDEAKVYPSLEVTRRVRKGMPLFHSNEGRSIKRIVPSGSEFSHIREYQPDDDPRNINWQSTARIGKLVSNVYQPLMGQSVIILLDCGRMMGIQNEGRTQLDQTLEAALGFASVALKRGDQVSLLAFADDIICWLPPGKGINYIQKMIEATFDIKPSYAESNYVHAWQYVRAQYQHKVLITLFTDMVNISFSDQLAEMLNMTVKKHHLLLVSMQDSKLGEIENQMPETLEIALKQHVARSLKNERKQALHRWRGRHVHQVDVPPQRMASAAIQSYLEIRRKQTI
ncbi:DUF58 domain-containing protein [Hazenella sp. IB182357]|uniref:DUF58 domain-containing protein n=1 Tax=Polycladospora coralii TaxID=2771432 RepID=A0A926NDD6_9BACL|nr:DUF58 domain-containing protein [Polycladospora coralii]MBD1371514.1 DUF58 domain-containing protein [Polycladospora coralii]